MGLHSRTLSFSNWYGMFSMGARRRSTAVPPSGRWDSVIMSTETTSAVRLATRALPISSRIWPRTAGTMVFLVWFADASFT